MPPSLLRPTSKTPNSFIVNTKFFGSNRVLARPASARARVRGALRRAVPASERRAIADDYFVDGIADAVRGKLTSVHGIEVIARASSTPR